MIRVMDNLKSFSCQHIRVIKIRLSGGSRRGCCRAFIYLMEKKKNEQGNGKYRVLNAGRKPCKPERFSVHSWIGSFSSPRLAASRGSDRSYLLAGPYFLATHPHPSKAPRANLISVTLNQLAGTSNRYHKPFAQALSVVRRDAIVPAVSAPWLVRRRSWHPFRGNWAGFWSRGCGRWGLQTKIFLGKDAKYDT